MFAAVLISWLAAHGADAVQIQRARGLDAPRVHERNPLLRPLLDSPATFGAVTIGGAAAVSWYLAHEHTRHPRATLLAGLAATAAESAIVFHNARVLRSR